MRNLTKTNHSRVWCLSLCLIFATAALGVTLTLPAVAAGTEVNIDNFTFTPKELTVKAGTTIVFRNRDDISVVGAKGEFHSKALHTTGDSFSFTVAKVGSYAYFCGPHPQMQGKIVVTP